MHLRVETKSALDTFNLGRHLGGLLQEPCIIGLSGDLGAGKTVFIQGLARGLGVPENIPVTSPTYTLVNEYPGRKTLYHVDLYRIEDPGELSDIGLDEILSGNHLAAVEWAERLPEESLDPDIVIQIEDAGDDNRRFSLFFYGPQAPDLVEAMKKSEFRFIDNPDQ
ncbi:MAG: tRNA (adenosine(37)-N6)-threonylcarbamoyltransferase complex ATPase subunit type 1 TsaE [Desulfobacteraceae bacterium]|nr:tRNA (adenosine(37)-N6)-threonylcarbamoyltransferase complex ATPase subunit type 1 TsaE [Desulfobacteraceae bacterium]